MQGCGLPSPPVLSEDLYLPSQPECAKVPLRKKRALFLERQNQPAGFLGVCVQNRGPAWGCRAGRGHTGPTVRQAEAPGLVWAVSGTEVTEEAWEGGYHFRVTRLQQFQPDPRHPALDRQRGREPSTSPSPGVFKSVPPQTFLQQRVAVHPKLCSEGPDWDGERSRIYETGSEDAQGGEGQAVNI